MRLPTKHCEYNPIELVWAKVKRYVADHNTKSHNTREIMRLLHEGFLSITPAFCSKVVEHCYGVIDKANDAETLIEVEVYPLIIRVDADDSDDEVSYLNNIIMIKSFRNCITLSNCSLYSLKTIPPLLQFSTGELTRLNSLLNMLETYS